MVLSAFGSSAGICFLFDKPSSSGRSRHGGQCSAVFTLRIMRENLLSHCWGGEAHSLGLSYWGAERLALNLKWTLKLGGNCLPVGIKAAEFSLTTTNHKDTSAMLYKYWNSLFFSPFLLLHKTKNISNIQIFKVTREHHCYYWVLKLKTIKTETNRRVSNNMCSKRYITHQCWR